MKKILLIITALLFSYLSNAQTKAVRVAVSGKGEPILFLPGFTTPGSVWNDVIGNLYIEKQSHTVSYAGFNNIQPIDTPWYPAIRQELIQYIERSNQQNWTIIGHSLGGNLAVDLAAALPRQVNKLILVDAIPCMRALMMPGVKASQLHYQSPYNLRMIQMNDTDFYNTAKMMASAMTSNKSKVDTLIQWSVTADRNTFVYGYTDLLKLDLRDILPSVKASTLILGAPFPDSGTVQKTYDSQYAGLKTKAIEIAPDGRHFIMFDQPGWLYTKINNFLKNE